MSDIKISELPSNTAPSSSAQVPMVDSGTTYRITIDNLVASSSRKDFSLYTALWDAIPISGVAGPLSVGDNDIYTVPANRRAIISGGVISNFTGGGGSVAAFAEIKHNGVYYRASGTANAQDQDIAFSGAPIPAILFEAGDTFAVNAATTSGGYGTFEIIEFSANSALKSSNIYGLSNGNNTVYTCPPGKTSKPFTFGSAYTTRSSLYVASGAVAPGVTTVAIVKSGGTPSVRVGSSILNGTNTIVDNLFYCGTVASGDSFVLNVTMGDSAQAVFISVIEF